MQLTAICGSYSWGSVLTPQILRVMKLTAILLLAVALQVSANGFGQRITLDLKNASLEKAFTEIEKQSGYSFVYGREQLASARTIDLTVRNEALESVLDLIFKDLPLTYTISGKYIALKQKSPTLSTWKANQATQPPIDVHGRVVNEKGQPVDGATITVKGTNKRVSTDENGNFSIIGIDENAVLVVSAVNIETYEVKVTGKTDLAILIVKTKITTGETVNVEANTGYQKIKPNETNGSIVLIDNKTLNQQKGLNILQRLDGVANGIGFDTRQVPGQKKLNFVIRGLSTINGPMDPLIVLDNFIYEGDLNNINPDDVESVTLLKDAAATSIWGARASNGVVIITTKKGNFNQKLKIEISSNIIFGKSPDLFSIPIMSTSDFIDVEQYLFSQGYKLSDTSSSSKPSLTPVYEILLKRKNKTISSQDSLEQINSLKQIDSRNEYNRSFYQDAVTQQFNLNLRGGNNNIAWMASGSYSSNAGTLRTTYNKVNLKFANTFKPIKNLQLNLDGYYTNSKTMPSGAPSYNSISSGGKSAPYLQFVDPNGSPISIDSKYRGVYTDTMGNGRLLDWKYYPLTDYLHDKRTTNLQEFVANIGLDYKVLNSLHFNVYYQYQQQWTIEKRLADIESFYTRDLINRFTRFGSNPSVPDTFQIPRGGILELDNSTIQSQNFRGQLNYAKSWKSNTHGISAIAGAEIREVITEGNSSTIYGYIEDPLSQGSVDYFTRYKTLVTGSLANIPGAPLLATKYVSRFVSAYINSSYTYKQRYSLSVSGRKDAANVFGLSTNDKWNPFWSTGIGWELSREKFYHISWLPHLKIKGTIGYGGNVDVNRSPLPVATSSTNVITNFPISRIYTLNNPSLRWEKTQQINLGVDFAMRNQIISGSLDCYIKKGKDFYGESPIDYTAWGAGNTIDENVANIEGKGIDLSIQTKNFDRKFKWTTQLLLSYNTSKTTAYFSSSANKISSFLGSSNLIRPVIGKPLFALVAYKWGGLNASGDPQGYLNGQLSTNYQAITAEASSKGLDGNIVYIGNGDPTLYGSLINTFSWKTFSFSFNISYKFGYYFKKQNLSYGALFAGTMNADFSKRWQKPGDELFTNVPAMVYTNYPQFTNRDNFYSQSEINVLKGDHIRLQYINISYIIPYRKVPFDKIQIYFNVANLGIIWRANKEKIDPSYPSTFAPNKQYAFGLKASF